MAKFSINIEAKVNLPIDVLGTLYLSLEHNETYVFDDNDFTSNTVPIFHDPEGDGATEIKILTLPTTGVLNNDGSPAAEDDELTLVQIFNGELEYVADVATITGHTDSFTFTVKDSGSGTFSAEIGTVDITIAAKENEPPSTVGDNTVDIDYGTTLVFTTAMFTTGTTPAYADPEGDAALNLKITSLPDEGKIKLNGVDVVINQIIPFTSINSGLLTYVSELADTDGDTTSFTFQVSDAGSGQFVG